MELRKQKEIEYYDKEAEKSADEVKKEAGSQIRLNPFELSSYNFLRNKLTNIEGKKILDYGCGQGFHLIWLAKSGGKVIGIDLSEKSLQIAKKRKEAEGVNAEFILMDCEKMKFPDDSFDIIFDGGTFSSLDLKEVFPELKRVLKPDGYIIGIETFGHNPFTNLKREINKLTGKRTKWATEHILKSKDIEMAKNYFNNVEVHYFHLISWLAFPFFNLPGGKLLLKLLESVDKILLNLSFLRKYAFKIVFVFSQPKK